MFWSSRDPDFEYLWKVILEERLHLVTPHHRVESLVSQNVELKLDMWRGRDGVSIDMNKKSVSKGCYKPESFSLPSQGMLFVY